MKLNWSLIAIVVIASLFGGIVGSFLVTSQMKMPAVIVQENAQKVRAAAEAELVYSDRFNRAFTSSTPTDFIEAAETSKESVVFIESLGLREEGELSGNYIMETGSGVITSSDGYIVTNSHVIKNAARVTVTLLDNREYVAKIVGRDAQTDLALLKIESEGLANILIGNSDSVKVGEWVLAVGNPFRLSSTVTAGIVSAKARSINLLEQSGIESFIQTDAAVNPGNSGGALINTNGELVGINTAIMSEGGGYEGFSFAIPSNLVKKVVSDLKEYGAVQRGWLGIVINDVDAPLAQEYGLEEIKGVFISSLTLGGAAKDAGMLRGDVILSINGTETNDMPEFMGQVGTYRPGDELEITFVREGTLQSKKITLRNQLNTEDLVAVRKDEFLIDLGFELRDLDSKEKSRFKTDGAYVVTVYNNSKVGRANIEPGYIITRFNNKEVNSVGEFIDLLRDHRGAVILNGFYMNYPGEFPYTFDI